MRILGLDIGSHSVKGVEIDSSFRRFQIHDYHEVAIEEGEKPSAAARRLLASLKKRPDRIIANIPSHQTTFRTLTAPSKNKKALQATVAFELEDELPFEMEDAVFDYAILKQNKGVAEVHAEATLSRYIETLLEDLRLDAIDPDILTSPVWAYRCLLNRVLSRPEDQEHPILLFHMGHQRTDLYLHFRGAPAAFRSIDVGSHHITRAIMEKYQLSQDEAERTQKENGFILGATQRDQASREQIEFSDTIENALRGLLQETRQFSLSAAATLKHSTRKVFLSGPVTLMTGFDQCFEEHVRIPTKNLRAFSTTSPTPIEYADSTEASQTLALGLAYTLMGTDKIKPINFRKGPFVKRGITGSLNWNQLRHPLIAAGAVMLSFFLSMTLQRSYYKSEIEKIDTRLKAKAKNFLGSVSQATLSKYLEDPSSFKDAIQKKLTAQRSLSQFLNEDARSPVKFLRTLSQDIPKSIVVDMVHFQVGSSPTTLYDPKAQQNVELSFLVESPPVEERLSSILTSLINDVKKEPSTEVPALDGQGKKWKATFSGKTQGGDNGN